MAKPILIYTAIFEELAEAITEKIIEHPQDEPIELWINSPGGSVSHGWSILAALQNHASEKNITVMGDASSMAFFMLLFADNVKAYDTSNFLIHRAASFWESIMNEDELKDIEDRNKIIRKKLEAKIDQEKFKEVTGKSFDDIFDMENRLDVRLNAQQAKKIGLIDKIIKIDPKKRAEIESRYYSDIAAIALPEQHEQAIINKNSNIMSKLTDLIFGEKESVLVGAIGESQFVYSKLMVGAKIKGIGKDANPISGSFEADGKNITVVENEITAVNEINPYDKVIAELKARIEAMESKLITAEDVAEVVVKLQEKTETELQALKESFSAAKIAKSNPKLPEGEFKQDINKSADLGMTVREKFAAQQKEMAENKRKNREA